MCVIHITRTVSFAIFTGRTRALIPIRIDRSIGIFAGAGAFASLRVASRRFAALRGASRRFAALRVSMTPLPSVSSQQSSTCHYKIAGDFVCASTYIEVMCISEHTLQNARTLASHRNINLR